MESIVIVDDHPLVRKGLAMSLDQEVNLEVCGQAATAEEGLELIDEKDPDLAILDISLPGMSGLDMVKQLQSRDPEQLILVLSRHDEKLYAERLIRAGARGYVMKLEGTEVIIQAIREVLGGRIFLSDEINDRLLRSVAEGGSASVGEAPINTLSDREIEVYELIGRGLGTREIAERLDISIKTVESYRSRIKKKLNITNASQLVRHAVRWVEDK